MVAGAACVARGYPACISTNPFFPSGVFCSSLNTGLCSVFSISIFHPISSCFTWVLTSNFFFDCDFMCYLPQSLSSPWFCVQHAVWQPNTSAKLEPLPLHCRGLSFCWISSHTTSRAWEAGGAGRPASAVAGHLGVAGDLSER